MSIFRKTALTPVKKKHKDKIVWLHYKFIGNKLGLVSKHKNGKKKYLVKIKDLKKI